MTPTHAYNELIDFIAGTSPQAVIEFQPSPESMARVWDLIERGKEGSLSAAETSVLEHYFQLEHIMRMAKVRARKHIDG